MEPFKPNIRMALGAPREYAIMKASLTARLMQITIEAENSFGISGERWTPAKPLFLGHAASGFHVWRI